MDGGELRGREGKRFGGSRREEEEGMGGNERGKRQEDGEGSGRDTESGWKEGRNEREWERRNVESIGGMWDLEWREVRKSWEGGGGGGGPCQMLLKRIVASCTHFFNR